MPSALSALNAITTYCDECPVVARCLSESRDRAECGVWGGVLATEASSREGRLEFTAADLRDFIRCTTVQCPACGRARVRQHANGDLVRHIDYATRRFCYGEVDAASVAARAKAAA